MIASHLQIKGTPNDFDSSYLCNSLGLSTLKYNLYPCNDYRVQVNRVQFCDMPKPGVLLKAPKFISH